MEQFPVELKQIDEAPEPLRSALRRELRKDGTPRLLIFTPAFRAAALNCSASVLAITKVGWLLVEETDGGAPATRASFSETLLVELSIILLRGRLKLDFASATEARSVILEFSTVASALYEKAVQLILAGIDGQAPAKRPSPPQKPSLSFLPLRFQNAVPRFTPSGEGVVAIAHWPAVVVHHHYWSERKLSPEAMFVLGERELILISEHQVPGNNRTDGYGSVATYCPLSRLSGYELVPKHPVATLTLRLRAGEAEETIAVEYAADHEASLEQMMRLTRSRAGTTRR